MEQINQQVGLALKQLRQQRGWSLDQAALACGVSKAMLGQIERGESSPTVVTLWRIAGGFHVPFSYFMADLSSPAAALPGFYRGPQPEQSRVMAEGIRVTTLLPFEPALGYEFLRVELPVGCEYHSVPHEEGSIELVILLSGQMDVWLQEAWQPLACGDVLRFRADQAHGYRNLGDQPACFHDLIHYAPIPTSAHESSLE